MPKRRLQRTRIVMLCISLVLLVTSGLLPATATPLLAQTPAQPVDQDHGSDAIAVTTIDQDLSITWPNPALVSASAIDLLQQLPTIRFQGYLLPMRLLTVAIEEGQTIDLQLTNVRTQSWPERLEPAAPLAPLAVEWQTLADPTAIVETVALPQAPLFVLRQGRLHGKPIAVLAVSPLYSEAGVTKMATGFSARAARTRLVDMQTLGMVGAERFQRPLAQRAVSGAQPGSAPDQVDIRLVPVLAFAALV